MEEKKISERQIRRLVFSLGIGGGITMTGVGIILPIFAKRFQDLGSGVEALGIMTMALGLGMFLGSPIMGMLADRYGRRPIILLSFASFGLVNLGFLWTESVEAFIAIRALEGFLTSGVFPAAMAMIGDFSSEEKQGKWIGILMAFSAIGYILGPVFGGVLYDLWGFSAPFLISSILGFLAFFFMFLILPETLSPQIRKKVPERGIWSLQVFFQRETWDLFPRPLSLFGMLLYLDFTINFGFLFVEPQMAFYFYEELDWTPTLLGATVGILGFAMALSQGTLGQIGDRWGKKPVILLGFSLMMTLYIGLFFITWLPLILLMAFLYGFGNGLVNPALSAYYLDITKAEHKSKIMGIKFSVSSLGGVLGPLLVALISPFFSPQEIFLIGFFFLAIPVGLATLFLKKPH